MASGRDSKQLFYQSRAYKADDEYDYDPSGVRNALLRQTNRRNREGKEAWFCKRRIIRTPFDIFSILTFGEWNFNTNTP